MRAAVRIVAAVLALTIGAFAQTPAPEPATGLIVGQVVDAGTGRPLAGAIVALNAPNFVSVTPGRPFPPQLPRVLTGSDGRFVFRDLPRGSMTITATRPGYVDGAYGRRRPGGPSQQLPVSPSERIGDVVIRMWKQASISGTIVDEVGEPLVGIGVRAFRRSVVAGIKRFADSSSGVTDDRGMYRIGNLMPGEYTVGILPREVSVPASVMEGAGRGNMAVPELVAMTVVLGSAIEVEGVTRMLAPGSPIPPAPEGARMFVYPPTYYPAAPSAAQSTPFTVGPGEERTGIDLQLRPVAAVTVSGIATGPEGPLPLTLRLEPPDATVFQRESIIAIASLRDGRFVFAGVPAGQYLLRADVPPRPPTKPGEPDGGLWAEMPVAVGAENVENLALALQPGVRVSGHLEFEGSAPRPPVAEIQQIGIAVEPMLGGAFAARSSVRTDVSGQFVSGTMPGGKYFVRVVGSPRGWMFKSASFGGRDVADTPLEISSDTPGVVITFTDKWSGLSGSVTTSRGAADPDALVVLFPADAQLWSAYGLNFRRMKSAQTTKTGQYTFPVVTPGEYYVAALNERDAGDWQDPAFLDVLARVAARVDIAEGEKKTLDLKTQARQ
jgi:carboxypeptidase family protein